MIILPLKVVWKDVFEAVQLDSLTVDMRVELWVFSLAVRSVYKWDVSPVEKMVL